MSRGGPELRSLPERLLGAAVLLLVTAVVLRVVVGIVESVAVPLAVGSGLLAAGWVGWRIYRGRSGGW